MPQPAKKRFKRERDVEEKPDLTVQLPDEILCHVLSFLSLRGKLRSEAVNHRFQRCILYLLNNKPQRLSMNFDGHGILNGYKVPLVKFANAVRSFAKKAKFTELTMDSDIFEDVHTKRLNSYFSALITSKNDCLSSLTTFSCNRRCTPMVLEELLAKCDKLSNLKLDMLLEGVTRKRNKRLFAPDLATALSNKGLFQLELVGGIADTKHPELLQLFHSLKPKTLKKLGLCFFDRVDIVGLVKELPESAWAALEEIRLEFWEPVRYPEIVLSLSELPSLLQCEMHLCYYNDLKNEAVTAMVSLFNKSIDLKVNCLGLFFNGPTGCQIVAMIHQTQHQHAAQVVFSAQPFSAPHLMLKHGNVSFDSPCSPRHCIDANCVQCNCFYPVVLDALRERARQRTNAHLENYQLDQCRIDNVVKDIWEIYIDGNMWKALATNTNEVNRTVEITFGWRWNSGGPEQFNISLGYGPCFSRSCIKCANIG